MPVPIAEAMLAIASRSGGLADDEGLDAFWNPGAEAKWRALFGEERNRIVVGINPGGDRDNRRWPPHRFCVVAAEIMKRYDARIVILGGPSEERVASQIKDGLPGEVYDLAGQTSIDELPYLIGRMDLLLTNDSGPMHIAAATKTTLVALFGPEDAALFGPYTAPELYRVVQKAVPCRPCTKRACTTPICLEAITPEEVLAACKELLERKKNATQTELEEGAATV